MPTILDGKDSSAVSAKNRHMTQKTLKKCYSFEGKGLHTGKYATMTVKPAPVNTGIVFKRTDIGRHALVRAIVENVSDTSRSTSLTQDGITVRTVEHILSALTGLGVDNAIIEVDNIEIPILDGSARRYSLLIAKDGLEEQDAERKYIEITEPVEVKDEKTGSWIRIEPAGTFSYDVTVDFNSNVLGVQNAVWNPSVNYVNQIGQCRTFVFFHEIEYLFKNNLIKGGDVDNAIVIVEHPVTEKQLDSLSLLFDKEKLEVTDGGYLNNLSLRFKNECGRHKLLDLIGDLRLAGGFINAKITAFKPGHTINTTAARKLVEAINAQ